MPNMRPRHCQSWRDAQQRSYGPTRKLCLPCTLKASVKNAEDCGSRKNDARLTAASRLMLDDDACEREGQDGDLVLVRLHNGFCASISACRNPRKLFCPVWSPCYGRSEDTSGGATSTGCLQLAVLMPVFLPSSSPVPCAISPATFQTHAR